MQWTRRHGISGLLRSDDTSSPFLAGPPCETWSCARAVAALDTDRHQPRVIRTLEHLWGLPCVRIKAVVHRQHVAGICLGDVDGDQDY